jgi:hypothetical protein
MGKQKQKQKQKNDCFCIRKADIVVAAKSITATAAAG